MKNTCKDCSKRHVGCHSTCTDYLNAKREHDTDRDNRRKFLIDAYTSSSCYRTKRFGQV